MKFLTKKDIEILKLVQQFPNANKSHISRQSKYLVGGLQHTFNKLEGESHILICKDLTTNKTSITLTKKGTEVLTRL